MRECQKNFRWLRILRVLTSGSSHLVAERANGRSRGQRSGANCLDADIAPRSDESMSVLSERPRGQFTWGVRPCPGMRVWMDEGGAVVVCEQPRSPGCCVTVERAV